MVAIFYFQRRLWFALVFHGIFPGVSSLSFLVGVALEFPPDGSPYYYVFDLLAVCCRFSCLVFFPLATIGLPARNLSKRSSLPERLPAAREP